MGKNWNANCVEKRQKDPQEYVYKESSPQMRNWNPSSDDN